MRDPAVEQTLLGVRRPPTAAVVAVTIAMAALIAASIMWLHYGTSVFFAMVAAGIAACF